MDPAIDFQLRCAGMQATAAEDKSKRSTKKFLQKDAVSHQNRVRYGIFRSFSLLMGFQTHRVRSA